MCQGVILRGARVRWGEETSDLRNKTGRSDEAEDHVERGRVRGGEFIIVSVKKICRSW